MKKQDMNKVFGDFFGGSLAKADAVIAEAKAKKETKKEKTSSVDLNKVYNDFFGDVMKRTEKF